MTGQGPLGGSDMLLAGVVTFWAWRKVAGMAGLPPEVGTAAAAAGIAGSWVGRGIEPPAVRLLNLPGAFAVRLIRGVAGEPSIIDVVPASRPDPAAERADADPSTGTGVFE